MLATPIRKQQLSVWLRMFFLTLAAVAFSNCATEQPKTALVADPDAAHQESNIPWNKPAKWESSVNVPGGIGGAQGDIDN
jgi:hypothetical protein